MHITPRRWQDKNAVPVDKFGIDPNTVFKSGLMAYIDFGHVIMCVDFAGIANANRHPEIS